MLNNMARLPAIGALMWLSACVPLLPYTDYVPQMSGGTVLRDRCWGNQSVEYIGRDITLTARVGKWNHDRLRLEVMFDIPKGVVVTPHAGSVAVSMAAGDARDVPIEGISRTGNPMLPMQAPGAMVGYNLTIGNARPPGHYWMYVPLDDLRGDDFTIALPAMDVNGEQVAIPPLHFHRQLRVQMAAPLQC